MQYLATFLNVKIMLQTSHFWAGFLKNQKFWIFEEISISFKKKVIISNFEEISNAHQKRNKNLAKNHENTQIEENSSSGVKKQFGIK